MSTNAAKHLLRISVVAAGLGLLGAVLTFTFLQALGFLHTLLWQILPESLSVSSFVYTLVICTIGGVLVGMCNEQFGNYPKELFESIQAFRKTGRFDYQHLPGAAVASLVSLGFGASLGPESALVAIVGGSASWIGAKIERASANAQALVAAGVSGSIGALFGAPLAGPAVALDEDAGKLSRLWTLIPSLVAAFVAFWFMRSVSSGGGYFNFDFPDYTFAANDLVSGLVVALAALVPGFVFLGAERGLGVLLSGVTSEKLKGAFGGFVFGVMAGLSSFLLFSGHEGIQEIADSYATLGGVTLILLGVAKAFAAGLLLASGWKGGRFFPLMFAGAAVGLGAALLLGAPVMVGIAAGMATALAVVLQRFFVTFLLLAFLVVPALYPVAIIGALLGMVAGKRLSPSRE